jgi:membrane protease YdiL (CAAX protease family)
VPMDLQNGDDGFRTCPPLDRTYNLIEVAVFLFLIVPAMVLSFFLEEGGPMGFQFVAVSSIVRDLSLVTLVFFFIWRNGEPLARLGLTRKGLGPDLFLGLALFYPVTFGADLLSSFLRSLGLSATSAATPPAFLVVRGPRDIALALILLVVVALAEETIFRGYLLLRFRAVNLGPLGAALLSSVIFSLGHGYEGLAGVVTVAALGFVLALVYYWRGSLAAPMVIHFLQDFTGLVLPALAGFR